MKSKIEKDFIATVITVLDSGRQVVINKGREHGVEEDQSFLLYQVGEELFDPETKESLGCLELVKGAGYASHVQDKMTTITSSGVIEYSYPRDPLAMFNLRPVKKEKVEVESFKFPSVGDSVKPI